MFSRSSSSDEKLDHTMAMLRQGQTTAAAKTDLRVRWNLDFDAAEKLVQQAEDELAAIQSSPASAIEQQRQIDNPGISAETWPSKKRRAWNFDLVEFWDSNRLAILFAGLLLFFVMLMFIGVFFASSSESTSR